MAMLALIVRQPGSQQLLQRRECSRGQHLGAQRVRLQLFEIGLRR
jgi:hypothetical protein